jgi:hypothetical protein
MTTNSLLRVIVPALVFTAACKSDFQAGINGNDGSAQEVAVLHDGGSPADNVPWSCDPFSPITKPITLTNVLGAGRDTDGTLYVVDQPQPGGERVFVSSSGTLQRQRVAGSGTESSGNGVVSYTFSISDHVPPFALKLETDVDGPTAMGVLQGTLADKTFSIGQQGSVLTLVPAAQVAGLSVANIPAETVIEYNATLSDGRALLVVRPRDDWTYQDFRAFLGASDHMVERTVDQVVRYLDGGSTTVNFAVDGVPAVASFPVSLTGVAAPPTLTIGATKYTLTLAPIASPPAGYSYFCLGNPPVDGGVDALSTPADGPATCRAPSPDYGPTSTFPVLPNGTPAAAITCPAACGNSAWPGPWPMYNIDIALPYGECAAGTPSCSALGAIPCACGASSGPVHDFNCSCEGGTWICRILYLGTAVCLPCPDAGVANMDQAPANDGAQDADGPSPVPTNPDGLNLAGLTAVTATVSWVPQASDPPGACHTDTKNVYSLDLQTRVLNWEHCAVDPKTAAAYRKTEPQALTDYEVTAARMLLAFLSTNYRTQCGADKETETLDLTFGDRVDKYQDDFYACNPPLDGRTYLANMDWIVGWLNDLGQGLNPLPSSFVELSVTSDLNPFPDPKAMDAATAGCGDAVYPTYDVTAATKKLSWSSCVSSSTGYKPQTDNRVLSQSEFASVMQSWSAIQLGATGDCATPRLLKDMVLITPPDAYSAIYVNDLAACNRNDTSGYNGSSYVVGLDDFSALLVSLAH